MNLPKIACLTATYGRYQMLRETIAAFLAQDWPNKELIVLNTHPVEIQSTDELSDQGVVILNRDEPDLNSLGACREFLLNQSQGADYIRTWDDDDLYLPWTLSQNMAFIGNAAAWKPSRSWFFNGSENKLELMGNNMEASILFRRSAVEQIGYRRSEGDEHVPLLEGMDLFGGIRTNEMFSYASYCYRWGTHDQGHASAHIGHPEMTLEQRIEDWKARNKDTGGGVPITPDTEAYNRKCDELMERAETDKEWLPLLNRDGTTERVQCPKYEQVTRIIDRFLPPGDHNAMEVGRMRGVTQQAREGDGCSTEQFLTHPSIRKLWSVDNDPATERLCCSRYGTSDKLVMLTAPEYHPVSLLYIDGPDDPLESLGLWKRAVQQRENTCRFLPSVVAIDDWSFGLKHLLIQRYLEMFEYDRRAIVGDAIVFTRD